MKKVMLVLSCTLFATGMNGDCNGDMGMPALDGDWRAVTSFGFTCFTIFNDKIAQIDDGCIGVSNPLSTPEPFTFTGNRIIMTALVGMRGGGETVLLTWDVQLEPDGSLIGTQTLLLSGGPDICDVVMNRR